MWHAANSTVGDPLGGLPIHEDAPTGDIPIAGSASFKTGDRYLSNEFLDRLLDCLVHRKMAEGSALISTIIPQLDEINLSSRNGQRFIGRYAMCVHAGY